MPAAAAGSSSSSATAGAAATSNGAKATSSTKLETASNSYNLLRCYNLKRYNRIWNLPCMKSMRNVQSLALFAIQISPDSRAVWHSRTCHAQSYASWLDHALLASQNSDSIVTLEIVTFEQVITRGPCGSNAETNFSIGLTWTRSRRSYFCVF